MAQQRSYPITLDERRLTTLSGPPTLGIFGQICHHCLGTDKERALLADSHRDTLSQTLSLDLRPGGDGRGRPFPAPDQRLRPGSMSLHHVRLVHGSPTRPTTGASALSSAISPLTWCSSTARTAPPSCAARIGITISSQGRSRVATSTWNSWPFTAPSPSAAPGSSIAARTSRARTSRRRWRSAAEPVRGGVGAQSSRLHLYSACVILSSYKMMF